MQQQSGPHLLVLRQALDQSPAVLGGCDDGQGSGQRQAVQVEHQLEQFTCRLARAGIGNLVERRSERVDEESASSSPGRLVVAHEPAGRTDAEHRRMHGFEVLPGPRCM